MEESGVSPVVSRRKNYFIDKKFQALFIIRFCLVVAVTGVLIMFSLFFMTRNMTTVSFMNSRTVVQTAADFLFPILVQTVAVATIIVSIATAIVMLFVSHRIAGPAYRFKKVLSSAGKGDFSGDFKIRRTDSLQDVAAALNEMILNARKLLVLLNMDMGHLKEKIDDASGKKIAGEEELRELKKYVSELDKTLSNFKV